MPQCLKLPADAPEISPVARWKEKGLCKAYAEINDYGGSRMAPRAFLIAGSLYLSRPCAILDYRHCCSLLNLDVMLPRMIPGKALCDHCGAITENVVSGSRR